MLLSEQLTYRSNIQIAHEMLEALAALIPDEYAVYFLCDSWYAAAWLLKRRRAQNWHVICRLNSNRLLDSAQVKAHDQRLTDSWFRHVRVTLRTRNLPDTRLLLLP